MPALHPETQHLLDVIRIAGRPAMQTLPPPEARVAYEAGRKILQLPPDAVAETRELTIPGPAGPCAARLYRGIDTQQPAAPAVLYLHGGGWVLGGLDSHDGVCRRIANRAGCVVLAVDYRMAPEHPFPAAIEDSAAALVWMVQHAGELGIDPARLAVAGDSAGGNLAAVLALMGRDGAVPAARGQVLLYPVTDLTMRPEWFGRPLAAGVPLTAETMRWFIDLYVPDPAQRTDWRASPLLAPSLAGTPPAFVLTVGQDPLAGEGRAYAERLEAEDVRVTAVHLSDHIHGMVTMNRFITAGRTMLDAAADFLRDCWSTSSGAA